MEHRLEDLDQSIDHIVKDGDREGGRARIEGKEHDSRYPVLFLW